MDEYYKKLHTMLFDALKQEVPDNCQDQKLNNVVAILLPYIEGYCITSSYLNISTKKLLEKLTGILYKILNQSVLNKN
jgi:hypothetical protein